MKIREAFHQSEEQVVVNPKKKGALQQCSGFERIFQAHEKICVAQARKNRCNTCFSSHCTFMPGLFYTLL